MPGKMRENSRQGDRAKSIRSLQIYNRDMGPRGDGWSRDRRFLRSHQEKPQDLRTVPGLK